jgi:hypothetical protein
VPGAEGTLLLHEVRLRDFRPEVVVGLLAAAQRAGEADTEVAVDVVVARDDEEPALFHAGGGQECFEERCGSGIFLGLAAMRHIARGEDKVGPAACLSVALDRLDQRAQDDVAVVGIAALEVEIGDVEPNESHGGASPAAGSP